MPVPARFSARGPAIRRIAQRVPWWLVATFGLFLILAWMIVADGQYRTIFAALRHGVWVTLKVTLIAFALACALGLLVALARSASSRVIREMATFYVEIVRGIPVLVLLFYIAFVGAPALVEAYNFVAGPLIGAGLAEPMTVRGFDFTWRAVFALMISYSAFISEIFRAGIEAVGRGQWEAADALGLRRGQSFRLVILPQAVRVVLPPLGNDFIAMIKDSALVSALGVQDITQLGKVYSSSSFLFFETYNVVAFLYLTMTVGLSLLVRALEWRLHRNGPENPYSRR